MVLIPQERAVSLNLFNCVDVVYCLLPALTG
jgi:hypothetical protein